MGTQATVEFEKKEASSSHLVKTRCSRCRLALNRTGGERSSYHEKSEWSLASSLM